VALRLAPNAPVRRTLTRVSFAEFAAQVLAVQAAYAAAAPGARAAALEPLRQTQVRASLQAPHARVSEAKQQ